MNGNGNLETGKKKKLMITSGQLSMINYAEQPNLHVDVLLIEQTFPFSVRLTCVTL